MYTSIFRLLVKDKIFGEQKDEEEEKDSELIDPLPNKLKACVVIFVYQYFCGAFSKFNPFTPEFLKWTLPSLNLDMSIVANGVSVQNKNRMGNIVDPDEMAHYEPSHLYQHCLPL